MPSNTDHTHTVEPQNVSRLRALRDDFLRAQLAGDRRAALRLLIDEGMQRGVRHTDAQAVIQEAQREIGRLWQENQITIAQEHMATAISQLVLSHVYQQAEAAPDNGRRVIVACVEGELHDFPARLVADALDLEGFGVRYLGANVPTRALLTMIREEKPDLVVLSVTMSSNVQTLREVIALMRREIGPDLTIAVGGSAVMPDGDQNLDVALVGGDAVTLVERAKTLLGVAP